MEKDANNGRRLKNTQDCEAVQLKEVNVTKKIADDKVIPEIKQ